MRVLSTVILLICLATPVYADSDGYYCAGDGFLAVEFRSFNTPGLAGGHTLKIAKFDDDGGPRWAGEVILEDFQVHLLVCEGSEVRIEGVGAPATGLLSYEVDAFGTPRISAMASDPSYIFEPRPGPENIGNWARPGMTELHSSKSEHRFQLRITSEPERQAGLILHRKRTVLEEVDHTGQVLRTLEINTGTLLETVD